MALSIVYTDFYGLRSTRPHKIVLLRTEKHYTPAVDMAHPMGTPICEFLIAELGNQVIPDKGLTHYVKGLVDFQGPVNYYNEVAIYDVDDVLILIGSYAGSIPLKIGLSTISISLPQYSQDVPKLAINNFQVSIAEYHESSGISWVVVLINKNLPHDMFGGERKNPGYTTPFMSKLKEQAEHEAQAWARFLDVPSPVECTCIMCREPKRRKE